jgi:dihydrolipoamide dehydrogenase
MAGNETRQVVVIGAGPGGYAAAFHAADLGLKVTLIDKEDRPGGVCLFRGCIPTKALTHAAKTIRLSEKASKFGIEFQAPRIEREKLAGWKQDVVKKLTGGLAHLAKKRKIEYLQANAIFEDSHTLRCELKGSDTRTIRFDHAILATGAYPAMLPNLPDSPAIMDSTGALDLKSIPESMLVIGGGYIGLELGSVYAALGTRITVAEMADRLMLGSDSELIDILHKSLNKQFDAILLKTRIAQLKEQNGGIGASFEGQDVPFREKVFEKVLVAVGRKPFSKGFGLENTQVQINEKGYVLSDKTCRTDDPAIFAIGDVTDPPQLAHKATHQGIVAAEIIAGRPAAFEPATVPFVEYTEPEVAECGLSEQQAREQGIEIEVTRFPWTASGRAATMAESVGLTKLVIEAQTGRILGVGIVGSNAGELIAEGALAVEMAALASDMAMTIHPHPTLSETLMEAAAIYTGSNINI